MDVSGSPSTCAGGAVGFGLELLMLLGEGAVVVPAAAALWLPTAGEPTVWRGMSVSRLFADIIVDAVVRIDVCVCVCFGALYGRSH